MSAILIQDTAGSLTVYLETSPGTPATGLIFSDVTADLKKEGEASFTAFTLTALNFTEIDNGFYTVALASTDTDILGNLELRLKASTTLWSLTTAYVSNVVAIPPTTVTPPNTSVMFGFIYNATGAAVAGASVGAYVISAPLILTTDDSMGVTIQTVSVKTDSSGYFALTLVEGATVEIIIPSISYRRTLTVPAGNTNLFSLP